MEPSRTERSQLTCILGEKKNSSGVKSRRSCTRPNREGRTKTNGLETISKDKGGKSTDVSLQFPRTELFADSGDNDGVDDGEERREGLKKDEFSKGDRRNDTEK